MNIMIVDDEKLLRNGFSHMTDWTSKGINVIAEAINGVDALEKIEKFQPDVVLTDIKMPIMDGVELTKQIKERYPHIAIIVLSGYDDYTYVRDSMKYGASDYLLKASIDIDEIYKALQKIKIINKNDLIISSNAKSLSIFDLDESNINLNKIKDFLEFQQFEQLNNYIIAYLDSLKEIPQAYLLDLLRDIFFFIQYQLDQLGSLSNYMKQRKYIHSSAVSFVKDISSAKKWVDTLINELARHCVSNDEKQNQKIRLIIDYIENNYSQEGLTLSYIADHFFINKNYLCDLFKAETNMTINEYIANVRIEHAKSLMRKGELLLTSISTSIGYTNHSYFCRIFRKKTGLTPSEYMNLYCNNIS